MVLGDMEGTVQGDQEGWGPKRARHWRDRGAGVSGGYGIRGIRRAGVSGG